jgi:hypothetical protein
VGSALLKQAYETHIRSKAARSTSFSEAQEAGEGKQGQGTEKNDEHDGGTDEASADRADAVVRANSHGVGRVGGGSSERSASTVLLVLAD